MYQHGTGWGWNDEVGGQRVRAPPHQSTLTRSGLLQATSKTGFAWLREGPCLSHLQFPLSLGLTVPGVSRLFSSIGGHGSDRPPALKMLGAALRHLLFELGIVPAAATSNDRCVTIDGSES